MRTKRVRRDFQRRRQGGGRGGRFLLQGRFQKSNRCGSGVPASRLESAIVAAMRPAILFPLFGEIRSLPGVGPRIEKLIDRVAGTRLLDLIFDLPCGVIDRSYRPKLIAAEAGRIATVTRERARPSAIARPQAALQGALLRRHGDRSNSCSSTPMRTICKKTLPEGEKRIVSGRIDTLQETSCRWRIPISSSRRGRKKTCRCTNRSMR